MAPASAVPVLDLHGSKDTTVPANVSLSADGYYYTVCMSTSSSPRLAASATLD